MTQLLTLKVFIEKEINFFGGTHIFKADDLVINELKTVSNLISFKRL